MKPTIAAERVPAGTRREPVFEPSRSRGTALGPLLVWRALPVRERRLIGPWCFLDRYGPVSFSNAKAMDVAPHPHIGLQTISWLLDGEVLHRDSLGSEAMVRSGGVNVMTAGRGIAHSEETPEQNSGRLNGIQLWIALPEAQRNIAPSFQHIAEVPRVELRGGIVQLFIGEIESSASAAQTYSDIIGAQATVHANEALTIPLLSAREHGFFVLEGTAEFEGHALSPNTLYYLGCGRSEASIHSGPGAEILLIGGAPFGEPVLMWWNFVARTPEEIAAAREGWQERRGFGEVRGYRGERLEAPPLSRLARPNPAS